jgi:hypothetical protein
MIQPTTAAMRGSSDPIILADFRESGRGHATLSLPNCEITVTTDGHSQLLDISYGWTARGWLANLTVRLAAGQDVVAWAEQTAAQRTAAAEQSQAE